MTCRWLGAAIAGALALAGACERRGAPSREPGPPGTTRADAAVASAEPRTLLALPASAYHVTIAAGDGDDVDLLTPSAAYHLAPGRAPERTPLELGAGATATRSSFIYWSRGALVETPKSGGAARRLVALAEPPQAIVAAAGPIAWLERATDGHFTLRALIGKTARTVYASPGSIDAIAAAGDAIVFVERPAGSDWRIGRVPAAGGAPVFTPLRTGRAPAMLSVRGDVFYYEGNGHEVRRLSPDLQRERSLASGFVCSPIAASTHVYCAQVEGLFELRDGERPRRLVPGSAQRMVTELAATPRRLLWVVDTGPDQLEVRELPVQR